MPDKNIQVWGGGPLTLGGFALLRADHPTATRALPIHRTLILCLATKRVTPLGEGPAFRRALSAFPQYALRSRPRNRSMSPGSGRNALSGISGMGSRWLSAKGVPASFRL